jgi:chromate transporter
MSDDFYTTAPRSPFSLFIAFTGLALQGFGGVLAIAQRVLVDQRRWLTREQFLELLTLSQVLPGPNICNLALMIGDRFFGWRGAAAALAGMLAVPLVLVLAAVAAYARFSSNSLVSGALQGMGAVAAGLIAGSGLKLIPALRAGLLDIRLGAVIGLATFGSVALARVPVLWVLPTLGPAACMLAWRQLKKSGSG